MTYKEFMDSKAGGNSQQSLDEQFKNAFGFYPTQQKPQVTDTPISNIQKLNITSDFYNQRANIAGPFYQNTSINSFEKGRGTILPSDQIDTSLDKANIVPSGAGISSDYLNSFKRGIKQNNAQPAYSVNNTTPQIKTTPDNAIDRAVNKIADYGVIGLANPWGVVRATSDIATLPFTTTASLLDDNISVKNVFDATMDMAKKDVNTNGEFSLDNAVNRYAQLRGIKKGGGISQLGVGDYAVLAGLGFVNMFGDPAFGISELKSAKEAATFWLEYSKTGEGLVTGESPVFKNVVDTGKPEMFSSADNSLKVKVSKPKSVKISRDSNLVIDPNKNTVKITGYVKRGKSLQTAEVEAKNVATQASDATGMVVDGHIEGNDLVLSSTGDKIIKKPTENIPMVNKTPLANASITPNIIDRASAIKPVVGSVAKSAVTIIPKETPVINNTATTPVNKVSNLIIEPNDFNSFNDIDNKIADNKKIIISNLKASGLTPKEANATFKNASSFLYTPEVINNGLSVGQNSDFDKVYSALSNTPIINAKTPTSTVGGIKPVINSKITKPVKKSLNIEKSVKPKTISKPIDYDAGIRNIAEGNDSVVEKTYKNITGNDLPKEPKAKEKAIVSLKAEANFEPEKLKSEFVGKTHHVNIAEPAKTELSSSEPVYPKNGSEYEIGEYYKKKEIWDNLHGNKTEKPKTGKELKDIKKEKIVSEYNKIQSLETPSDEDFVKMMELEDKYRELTGEDIINEGEPTLDNSSYDRDVYLEKYDNEPAMWSRGAKTRGTIADIKERELRGLNDRINNIEAGREDFNVPQESINIVRKYGARITKNIRGTEGHNIGKIVGVDSLINPLALAHELTHYLTMDSTFVLRLLNDPQLTVELANVYKKYYPGKPKDISTVKKLVIYNEGLAEFVRQHLNNPKKITKEFPGLSTKFLGTGPYSSPQVNEMYNDINKMIYTYQHLSGYKQYNSLMVSNLDFKKMGIRSMIVGRAGRIQTYSQDSLHPFNVLDKMIASNPIQKKKNFVVDSQGMSTEMTASMYRPAINVALKNLDPKLDSAYLLNETGDIEKFLDFGIGNFLEEIKNNGDLEDYGSYLNALDSQRDRTHLEELKKELEIEQNKPITGDKDTSKNENKIKRLEKNIRIYNKRIATQPVSSEKQLALIYSGRARFAKYQPRWEKIIEANLRIKERSGKISKKSADEMLSRPGYAPSFRSMVDDVNSFVGTGKRSAVSQELKLRRGSNKAVINPLLVIPKMITSTLANFNMQTFDNLLFEKGMASGIVQEMKKGTVNEPGTRIHAKDGKLTKYRILDKAVADSADYVYGMTSINSGFLKFVDDFMHGTARTFQLATTQYNPYFSLSKNIFLDIPTSFVLSRTGYVPVLSQVTRAFKKYTDSDAKSRYKQYSEEYNSLGGGAASLYEISYNNKNPLDILKGLGIDDKKNLLSGKLGDVEKYAKSGLSTVGKGVKAVLNATERFTRLEEYIRARENGDTVAEAYEKSRNVSGSFHKSGIITGKYINRYVPYSNAGVQLAKQYGEAFSSKEYRLRVSMAIIISSLASFATIAGMISDVDNSETEDERNEKMNVLYNYLDKSSYEKLNYQSVGKKFKFASNPIFSSPGTLAGLIMLQKRIPEYKINYGDFAYQTLSGIIPNQLTPDVGSSDDFLASIGGKAMGAVPLSNAIMALSGFKTYPGIKAIENQSDIQKIPSDRYKDDTNNLAVLLGQFTGISPLRLEGAIIAFLGTGGNYSTDALGALLMPNATKDELGIIHKSFLDLVFTNPTHSAITQNDKTLRGETGDKIYNVGNDLTKEQSNLVKEGNRLLSRYGVSSAKDLPEEAYNDVESINKRAESLQQKQKEVKKAEDAMHVISTYETRKKEVPIQTKNALNRYILAIDSLDFRNLSKDDIVLVNRAASMYDNLNKTDWKSIQSIR